MEEKHGKKTSLKTCATSWIRISQKSDGLPSPPIYSASWWHL